ncbi:MAG: hypothetical protein LH468_08435 [Nocardioides sp.]|nr:hypothetical protein [Nocardioides sp.]
MAGTVPVITQDVAVTRPGSDPGQPGGRLMQELLGRIMRLDPSASLGLRVIACFDELVVGNVNTRALLASAASLAGCVAGFGQDRPARTVRVAPDGHLVDGPATVFRPELRVSTHDDLTVWLGRGGPRQPHAPHIVGGVLRNGAGLFGQGGHARLSGQRDGQRVGHAR